MAAGIEDIEASERNWKKNDEQGGRSHEGNKGKEKERAREGNSGRQRGETKQIEEAFG